MQTFFVFCQNTSSRIAKTEIYVSTGKLGRKVIFIEKLVGVLPSFRIEKKTFGLLAKIFWQLCENCFQCVHRVILRSFFEKQIPFIILANWATPFWHWVGDFRAGLSEKLAKFLIISGYWAKNVRSFDEKKAVGLPKLLSTCLQEQFEKLFFLKKSLKFLSSFFSGTKRKLTLLGLSEVSSTCP